MRLCTVTLAASFTFVSIGCVRQRSTPYLSEDKNSQLSGEQVLIALDVRGKSREDMILLPTKFGIDFEGYVPELGAIFTPVYRSQLSDLNDAKFQMAQLSATEASEDVSGNSSNAKDYDYTVDAKGYPKPNSPWLFSRYDRLPAERWRSRECNLPENDPYSSKQQLNSKDKPDSGYKTYEEVLSEVGRLQASYPNLIRKFIIDDAGVSLENFKSDLASVHGGKYREIAYGRTVDGVVQNEFSTSKVTSGGRDFFAILVTKGANSGEVDPSKPNILFMASTHARELMTTEVALDMIENLAQSYRSSDPKTRIQDDAIRELLEKTNVWIVPVVNPDGLNKLWTSNRMQRKNGNEVDIARNFPVEWGECNGSATVPDGVTYRGSRPASEIETRNLMYFIGKYKPVFTVSYHSTGEYILFPGTCQGTQVPNRELTKEIAKDLANLIPRDCSNSSYSYGELFNELYNADGEVTSYAQLAFNSISFLFEINDGRVYNQPNYDFWRLRTVEKVRPAWKYLISRTWSSAVYGVVDVGSVEDSESEFRKIRIQIRQNENSKSRPRIEATHHIKRGGYFHIILQPGTYRMEIQKPDFKTVVKEFKVDQQAVNLQTIKLF